MIGRSIGRYTVLTKIGHGGMGEVYLAHDAALDRKVALKLLPESSRRDPAALRRFLREARAAAAIDHSYICKIFDAGEAEGIAYIAMEYVEGETLDARLRRGPVPPAEGIHLIGEVIEALVKAHEKNVVHRDIKPSNIMLVAGGHVKVLDFGLARRLASSSDETLGADSVTQAGHFVGTPSYMSPEQASGGSVDVRSDLFSLGIVAYELLTGDHPFRRPTVLETGFAIMHHTPPPVSARNPGCPAPIDQVLSRLLAKRSESRYQTAAELFEDWRALSSGVSSSQRISVAPALPARPPGLSFAVMPFLNLSRDSDQEYFSDGVTEDIIAELSRVPGFRVIARTSVMRYKNSGKDISEIGSELRVQYVLEGSIRRSGDRLRINAGLVDVESHEQRWSETFDRQMDDVFAIQSEVARRIAQALSLTLSAASRPAIHRAPVDMAAYHLFLKGRHFMHKLVPDAVSKAIDLFREALDMDPAYARSHAGLATCYAHCGHFDFMPPREAFPRALTAARNAIRIQETISEAHAAMGLCQVFHEWDWPGAELSFRRAIELDPNSADALTYSSWGRCVTGQFEEAVEAARRACDLDPLSAMAGTNLGYTLILASRFEEAIDQLTRTLEFDPSYIPAKSVLGLGLVLAGQAERGIVEIDRWGWRRSFVGIGHVMIGNLTRARAELERLLDPSSGLPYRPSEIALLLLGLGEREEAAAWLERAFTERDYMLALQSNPVWAIGHDDPLVADYRRRMGIAR